MLLKSSQNRPRTVCHLESIKLEKIKIRKWRNETDFEKFIGTFFKRVKKLVWRKPSYLAGLCYVFRLTALGLWVWFWGQVNMLSSTCFPLLDSQSHAGTVDGLNTLNCPWSPIQGVAPAHVQCFLDRLWIQTRINPLLIMMQWKVRKYSMLYLFIYFGFML